MMVLVAKRGSRAKRRGIVLRMRKTWTELANEDEGFISPNPCGISP
jgi:hypothetical protein